MKSELTSPLDRFANLMHIQDDQGNQYFQEADIWPIEDEVFFTQTREEIEHDKEIELFKNRQEKLLRTPAEQIMERADDQPLLKTLFEGYSTGVLRVKDQQATFETLQRIADDLNLTVTGKQYEPFIDDNGTRFLVEKTIGAKVNIKNIKAVIEHVIKPLIEKVF